MRRAVTITPKTKPEFWQDGDTLHVKLGNGEICLLDADCAWILEEFGSFQKTKNHVTCERAVKTQFSHFNERIYVHRLVMHDHRVNDRTLFQVDHKNRNPLDNRKRNLRWASPRQNAANSIGPTISSTGYRGVTDTNKHNRRLKKPFLANCAGKNLGYYLTAEEAARAYDAYAKTLYGQFAILNFPEESDGVA